MHLEVHLRRLNYFRPGVDDVTTNKGSVYGVTAVTNKVGVSKPPVASSGVNSVTTTTTSTTTSGKKEKVTAQKGREMEDKLQDDEK